MEEGGDDCLHSFIVIGILALFISGEVAFEFRGVDFIGGHPEGEVPAECHSFDGFEGADGGRADAAGPDRGAAPGGARDAAEEQPAAGDDAEVEGV